MNREEYLQDIQRRIESVHKTLNRVDRQTQHYEKYKYVYNTAAVFLGTTFALGCYWLILFINHSMCL